MWPRDCLMGGLQFFFSKRPRENLVVGGGGDSETSVTKRFSHGGGAFFQQKTTRKSRGEEGEGIQRFYQSMPANLAAWAIAEPYSRARVRWEIWPGNNILSDFTSPCRQILPPELSLSHIAEARVRRENWPGPAPRYCLIGGGVQNFHQETTRFRNPPCGVSWWKRHYWN